MPTLYYNERAMEMFHGFLRQGRIPHAFLIEGPEGCGKKTMATHMAQSMLCAGEEKPCGSCGACTKVERGVHPDVCFFTVPPDKKLFPVGLVREIREQAYISPNENDYKIDILDKAHTMNNEAQNALLKLLEEPPAFLKLILLCENRSMMLPTILSRVISIPLAVPSVEQCAQVIGRIAPGQSEELYLLSAAGAGGNVGRALAQLDTAKPSKAAADARGLRTAMVEGNRYACLRIFAGYEKDREGLAQVLTLLSDGFARLAVAKHCGVPPVGEEALFSRVRLGQAVYATECLSVAIERTRHNGTISLLCADLTEKIVSAT